MKSKAFARLPGDVQARLLLSAFYFTLLAPFAIAIRLLFDPLEIVAPTESRGRANHGTARTLEWARRYF